MLSLTAYIGCCTATLLHGWHSTPAFLCAVLLFNLLLANACFWPPAAPPRWRWLHVLRRTGAMLMLGAAMLAILFVPVIASMAMQEHAATWAPTLVTRLLLATGSVGLSGAAFAMAAAVKERLTRSTGPVTLQQGLSRASPPLLVLSIALFLSGPFTPPPAGPAVRATLIPLAAEAAPVLVRNDTDGKLRIVYVVNSWWPKVDGAAIALQGHVRHFAEAGHEVLVLRPHFSEEDFPGLAANSRRLPDPMAGVASIHYVFYDVLPRCDGYEIEVDKLGFAEAERRLRAFRPDVVLVADPDYFLFDAFRIPGVSMWTDPDLPPPVTIGCFTTFLVDTILLLPEFEWLHWLPGSKYVLDGTVAWVYSHFDHTFVNGQTSIEYLQRSPWHRGPAKVIASRGVQRDFCEGVPAERCAANEELQPMLAAPSGTVAFVYVGRLAFDKSVDAMLEAFAAAHARLAADGAAGRGGGGAGAVLYVAGYGALEGMVREYAARLPGAVRYLGQLPHADVGCALRHADVYLSAARNETFGRSQVEALRCGVPVLGMASCNLHIVDEVNGLVAEGAQQLTDAIVRVVREPELLARMKAAATAPDFDPNAEMLQAVLTARKDTLEARAKGTGRRRVGAWHPLWSWLLVIGDLVMEPPSLSSRVALAAAACLACAVLTREACRCCCASRPRRKAHKCE